jgi:hypothetical protein
VAPLGVAMSDEPYPDRMAVLKSITGLESNLTVLKNFVESYVELREKGGPNDAMAVEFAKSFLIPKEAELELSQHEIGRHLPKMLAAGDQAAELVESTMKANDDAASFSRELKEKLCPELFGGESTAAAAQPQAATTTASGKIHVKTMTGKLIPIDADPSDTIDTIKVRYQDSEGTPPDQQRLISKGTELKDTATLSECNVKDGDTIHIVLKLRQVSVDTHDGQGGAKGGGCCLLQ